MLRKIIEIDKEKYNGCGLCAGACREGAIGMENGKAKLLRDDYCDGLGNCLPVCPTGAITFVERDAAAYNEEEVERNRKAKGEKTHHAPLGGCPGSNAKRIVRQEEPDDMPAAVSRKSNLNQCPVQIKLVPMNAPYFENAALLIAADCAAYAYAAFHADFMRDRITLIGCPKLDEGDYTEKLTAILKNNAVKSLAVARMEVPCCAGIANAAVAALKASGKMIPWRVVTFSTDGKIVSDE